MGQPNHPASLEKLTLATATETHHLLLFLRDRGKPSNNGKRVMDLFTDLVEREETEKQRLDTQSLCDPQNGD